LILELASKIIKIIIIAKKMLFPRMIALVPNHYRNTLASLSFKVNPKIIVDISIISEEHCK
jgi:hypothetical protein